MQKNLDCNSNNMRLDHLSQDCLGVHLDFTIEVKWAIWVLDKRVVIKEACAEVEAQTKTVWRQAQR